MNYIRFYRLLLASIVLVPLANCSARDSTKHWTEEVTLDDGSVILVRREVTFSETNALGGWSV